VLTDQDLIAGLRRELADVQPPVDLIDRLREQAARGPVRGRRYRAPVGFLTIAASVVVVIVITVGALVFARHRTPARGSGSTASHAAGAEMITLAQLKSSFAVLRRPQTAADRALRVVCAHPCQEDLVPRMTRLARTLPDGSRVFLSVWRVRAAQRIGSGDLATVPAGSYMLDDLVVRKGREAILDPGSLAQTPAVLGGKEFGTPAEAVESSGAPLWTGVVPDGVGTVRWTFACVHPARPMGCPRPPGTSPTTVTVNVIDNVAATHIGEPGNGTVGAISAVWLDPAGRPLASFSNAKGQTAMVFRPHGLILRSRLLLNADGLAPLSGQITFGASPAQLERLLDPIVGQPAVGYQATLDECGVDHQLIWPIVLDPTTGELKRGDELTLLFHRRRFVGYQYGGPAFHPDRARVHVQATTAAGLAIGDTLATGQRLYGHAFRISTAQGGTWQASTPLGRLTGYAFGKPSYSDVSSSSRIASIDAGDVGCPALSP